ncbi:MAG: VWA domain-containing protein [Sulfurospirillum sp.]|nr:VWA domain-containing protein [Sulfurospirillum sp.]MBL0703251.1 VWA domain-containing protein [Sulfurospirillum sp.]
MTFVYPWFFLLLFLIPFFYRVKKFSLIEQVFSKEMLLKLEFNSLVNKNFKFHLLVISSVLIIIALARPVILLESTKETDEKSFNFVIALDISKSMEANDVFPSRLLFAKQAIYELMNSLPEANIAVIAYTNDAFLVSPFSNDFESIKFLLSNLDSNSLSTKGSQILSALEATNRIFESTDDKKKNLLLVGDGADGRDFTEIQNYIKTNNITLHVLSVGTKKGTTLSDESGRLIKDIDGNIVISKRDDSLFKVTSGGAYLSSNGSLAKIDWLANEIKNSVDKKEVKKDILEDSIELFYYALIISMFCIFFVFNSIRVPFMLVVFFIQTNSNAGMFDFIDIYKAKKSYKNEEYQKAEKHFAKIEAKYNEANALYKQKKYEEALKKYESIEGFSGDEEYKRLYNIGNSYANLEKIDKAIKSYEEALEIKHDEDTKANLEYMKKKREEKEKDKKQNNKQEQNSKENEKNKEKEKEKSDNKNGKKPDEQKKDKTQTKQEESKKKMSEAEAKKWEKHMDNKEFKTKPMQLNKGEQNEIYW